VTRHNPERRLWRGKSYRRGGAPVVAIRALASLVDQDQSPDADAVDVAEFVANVETE